MDKELIKLQNRCIGVTMAANIAIMAKLYLDKEPPTDKVEELLGRAQVLCDALEQYEKDNE